MLSETIICRLFVFWIHLLDYKITGQITLFANKLLKIAKMSGEFKCGIQVEIKLLIIQC